MKTSAEWSEEIIEYVSDRTGPGIGPSSEEFIKASVETAVSDAFRAGFEHAVAGGEEASKCVGIPASSLALVCYFDNELDRAGFIQAFKMAKPRLTEMVIPERRK